MTETAVVTEDLLNFGYTFSDKREIVRLTNSREAMLAMRDEIFHLRQAFHTQTIDPEVTWTEYVEQRRNTQQPIPEALSRANNGDRPSGIGLLHEVFDNFQQARKVVRFWQNLPEREQQEAVRQSFPIPKELPFEIDYLDDCCVVKMSRNDLNIFRREYVKQYEFAELLDVDADGFLMTILPLQTAQGAQQCRTIFVAYDSPEGEKVITHEREHSIQESYYFKKHFSPSLPFETETSGEELGRAFVDVAVQEDMNDDLLETKPYREIQKVVQFITDNILPANRKHLFEELLAYSSMDIVPPPIFARSLRDQLDLHQVGQSASLNYGGPIKAFFDGIFTQIRESDGISRGNKFLLEVAFRERINNFGQEMRYINNWVDELWESLPETEDKLDMFLSSMYAIPLERMWAIGYFLGDTDDQVALKRKQLQFLKPGANLQVKEGDRETYYAKIYAQASRDESIKVVLLDEIQNENLQQDVESLLGRLRNKLLTHGLPKNKKTTEKLVRQLYTEVYLPARLELFARLVPSFVEHCRALREDGVEIISDDLVRGTMTEYLNRNFHYKLIENIVDEAGLEGAKKQEFIDAMFSVSIDFDGKMPGKKKTYEQEENELWELYHIKPSNW